MNHKVVGPAHELDLEHQDQLLRQFADQHRAHEARIEALLERHQLAMDKVVERLLGCNTLLRSGSPPRIDKKVHGTRKDRCLLASALQVEDCQAHFVPLSDDLAGLQRKIMHAEGFDEGSLDTYSSESSDGKPCTASSTAAVEETQAPRRRNSGELVVSTTSLQSKCSMRDLDATVEKAEASLQHKRYSITAPLNGEPFSRRALAICQSPIFEWSVGVVILANAIVIGASTQWSFQHIGQELPWWMEMLNLAFLVVFALEILLRLLAEGRAFLNLRAGNGSWNIFDMVLIAMSVVDTVISISPSHSSSSTIVRIMRIARLFHTMRIIRIARFFDDLRLLVVGIWNCGKTLLWSAGLLIMIMYIYGVCIMQSLTFGIADGGVKEEALLLNYYGTLARTIYTLFMALLGGISWGEVAEPLQEVSPLLLIAFCSYIAFAMTCVLNIITGIFVDKAKHFQSDDKLISEYVEGYKRRVDSIRLLFQMHDCDNSGTIEFEEFAKVFYDLSSQAYFESLGVQVSEMSAEQVFQELDNDGDGVLSIDDFAAGITNLKGLARKIDARYLLQVSQRILLELEELREAVHPDGPATVVPVAESSLGMKAASHQY